MSNTQGILEEFSVTRRTPWPALSGFALIISFHIFGGLFFGTNENSVESNLSIRPNSQRCGDHIYFFFNDRRGKNIDPSHFQSIAMVDDVVQDLVYKDNVERKEMKGFLAPTRCGLGEMKVTIAYQNKRMDLILKRIPGDHGDIFLYSIPFSKGTFTFDFENNLDKTCEDKVKGWHGECTISPKRLKKTAPHSSKQGRAE
jgi:hypothetical protein